MPNESEAERTEEEEGEDTIYPRQFEEKSLSDSEIKVQKLPCMWFHVPTIHLGFL